jgi:hypothetical protein
VLWIEPRGRPVWKENKTRQKREKPHHRSLQQTGAGKPYKREQPGDEERVLWLPIFPRKDGEGFIPANRGSWTCCRCGFEPIDFSDGNISVHTIFHVILLYCRPIFLGKAIPQLTCQQDHRNARFTQKFGIRFF